MKAQIPIRTWSEWDEAEPGFVEIDCVGHEGGDPSGDFCQTLTVTDIHTRWTKTAAVREQGSEVGGRGPGRPLYLLPSRVRGIDSHNGSDLINNHRFRHCETGKTTPYLDRTA